jgi:hypothetical protein
LVLHQLRDLAFAVGARRRHERRSGVANLLRLLLAAHRHPELADAVHRGEAATAAAAPVVGARRRHVAEVLTCRREDLARLLDDVAASSEVARVVVGHRLGVLALVEPDPASPDRPAVNSGTLDTERQLSPPLGLLHHELEHPVGVATLSAQQVLDPESLDLLIGGLVFRLHGGVVAGKQAVVGGVEVARAHNQLMPSL